MFFEVLSHGFTNILLPEIDLCLGTSMFNVLHIFPLIYLKNVCKRANSFFLSVSCLKLRRFCARYD